MDKRPKGTCPSGKKLMKKDCASLIETLTLALEKQIEQLVEAEGEGTELERELNKELTWVGKVNAEKADREAAKKL